MKLKQILNLQESVVDNKGTMTNPREAKKGLTGILSYDDIKEEYEKIVTKYKKYLPKGRPLSGRGGDDIWVQERLKTPDGTFDLCVTIGHYIGNPKLQLQIREKMFNEIAKVSAAYVGQARLDDTGYDVRLTTYKDASKNWDVIGFTYTKIR